MPGRERVILFFYTKYKLKFIAIIYTAVLKYNKAYFKKVSKVYVTVYDLITFRKSMLLYQGKRKKAGAPRKKGNRNLLRKRQEERNTRTQNKIKPDMILKEFWRDNERFADLFNTVLFKENEVVKQEDLSEADTDLSSVLKMNGHAETIQRIFDVVKKTANGVDYIIWGIENQETVHYAMPLRHMLNDSLIYLKECNEISAKHRKVKDIRSSGEFLSGLKKEDRLHPVVSICVYYGENEWDGPLHLTDMLEIPNEVKPIISDYKMNLVQVRECIDFRFRNTDISTVFEIIQMIYERDYKKMNALYGEKRIDTELALVIGAVTNSQRIIDQALELEVKGEEINMCKALEELEQKGREEGYISGIETGKKELLRQQVEKKLSKGKNVEKIADELEEEVSVIRKIIEDLQGEV